jgi:dipeptidyl aminopeptidase/acylaminoacyl peptidase
MLADKITTPLLILHCMNDTAVPWGQAVELFVALRRLNKKVWMLQYDNGGHAVSGQDAIDFTTRITQFFEHYLKGAPAPIWMTKGIPAIQKGIITGYELDTTNNQP